jgi:hypothetical protein
VKVTLPGHCPIESSARSLAHDASHSVVPSETLDAPDWSSLLEKHGFLVVVRIRDVPQLAPGNRCLSVKPGQPNCLVLTADGSHPGALEFHLDHIFPPQASNLDLAPLMSLFCPQTLQGPDAFIIADGQSGSGKTFTMMQGGTHSVVDLVARVLYVNAQTCSEIELSGVEFWDNTVLDLLLHPPARLERSSAKQPGRFVRPKTPEAFEKHVAEMMQSRHTRLTALNQQSSRGHLLLTIRLGRSTGKPRFLWLLDLAGSENEVTNPDKTMQSESLFISSSRTALKTAFGDRARPNRDSKVILSVFHHPTVADSFQLTSSLLACLQPEVQTVYIGHLRPDREHHSATRSTVDFAMSVSMRSARYGPSTILFKLTVAPDRQGSLQNEADEAVIRLQMFDPLHRLFSTRGATPG